MIPLSVTGIAKRYGTQQVLENIELDLKAGEMFGLIGLNGVGKTTLIKIILGLSNADSGDCRIFEQPGTDAESRRQLIYLPEKFQPSRYLTGREYLALSLSYYNKPYDHAKACELAAALDLDPLKLASRVASYSKGMGQKLGLIGAFLADLPLMILDEPMSGLDPRARIRLKNQLLESKKQGKTIFFSSHILSDIDEICDRIGVIHDRRLIYTGTPNHFKVQYPESSLERSFLKAIAA